MYWVLLITTTFNYHNSILIRYNYQILNPLYISHSSNSFSLSGKLQVCSFFFRSPAVKSFSPSLLGCRTSQRSFVSFLRFGYLLENIMTMFGVLNRILSLSYFDVVACPSLISSKSLYKFRSSPYWDRTSLKRNMSIVARGNFFSTLQAFACFTRKSNLATRLCQ